ncbi:MAG: ATP-binding protein [Syntrophobacter sp.]
MKDEDKSREQLLEELKQLRERRVVHTGQSEPDSSMASRVQRILDELPFMVALIDSACRFVYCNKLYGSRFGINPEALAGKPVEEVLSPEAWQTISGYVARALAGEVTNFDTCCKTPGETATRTFRISYVPHAGPDGGNGFLAFGVDITALDEMEKHRYIEEELLNAKKLESIGVLAGGIAHDFNNLLFVILGNISMAQTKMKDEDPASRHLSEAEKACLRARDLTQKFITFASGHGPPKSRAAIRDLVENVVSLILSGSSIVSDILLPERLWKVEVDEDQMRQALTGVIANAREAMPRGGTLRIVAENLEILADDETYGNAVHGGKYVRISIEDDGAGIPEDDLGKIFDPYFSTKFRGNQKRMGFGLAIAHSVIKGHNGCIKVKSSPGKGTDVTILLPALSTLDYASISGSSIQVGRKRVLVMDDEEMLGDLAKTMIEHLGYEAGIALNGEQAIEMYAEAMEEGREWDMVILDLTVKGGMGGKDTLQKLLYLNPGVEAIVSSGYSNDPIMSDYRKYGFKGVLSKPYDLEQLKDILNRMLCKGGPASCVNAGMAV